MRKFVLIPDTLYKNLIDKSTDKSAIDDFSEHLMVDSLENRRNSLARRHAQYNQRLPGYLEHSRKVREKPVRVVFDGGDVHQVPVPDFTVQKTATQATIKPSVSTEAGVGTEKEEEESGYWNPQYLYDEDYRNSQGELMLAEDTPRKLAGERPQAQHPPLPPSAKKKSEKIPTKEIPQASANTFGTIAANPFLLTPRNVLPAQTNMINPNSPHPNADLVRSLSEHVSPASPDTAAARRKSAYEALHEKIKARPREYGVNDKGQVLLPNGGAVSGSNFNTILTKRLNGTQVRAYGETQLVEALGKHSNHQVRKWAQQLFGGGGPMVLKNKKVLSQRGAGTFKRGRADFRFKVRAWKV